MQTINPQIVIFMGPEGSGKTTQALKLKEEMAWPYISTGNIIRDLAANDFTTRYGDECRELEKSHGYLSGQTLLEILTNRLKEEDTREGFILDGGMRTVEETINFPTALAMASRDHLSLKVVLLQIPNEEAQRRLSGVGGRNRADDTVEGVQNRLANYHHRLEERLEIIKGQAGWSLVEIDATVEVETVYERVRQVLLG